MSTAILPAANGHPTTYTIDHDAVLKAVGLNVRDPNAQALLLTCQRYGLDPILKHIVLIQQRPYVTRDGLLHVAHRAGTLDGIVVEDQGETQTHWTARVAVYRKDMRHPFTYVGRYPKDGGQKKYGPEMAVKCAEVMALRRAFDVGLCAHEELWDREDVAEDAIESHPVKSPPPSNNTGYGRTGAYADPEAAAAYRNWVKMFAETINGKWLDYWTDPATGDVPEQVKDFWHPNQLANHLVKHFRDCGLLATDEDQRIEASDRPYKLGAVVWTRDPEAATVEAEDYARKLWREKVKATKAAIEATRKVLYTEAEDDSADLTEDLPGDPDRGQDAES